MQYPALAVFFLLAILAITTVIGDTNVPVAETSKTAVSETQPQSGVAASVTDAAAGRQQRSPKRRGKNGGGGGGGSNDGMCRYIKGPWSECDVNTKMRSRTLTLKRSDQANCEATKEEQRKCKKACRYVKGTWNECDATSHVRERIDQLKPGSDPTCDPSRSVKRKCKINNNNKDGKASAGKRGKY